MAPKTISEDLLEELQEKYDKNDDEKLTFQEFQGLAAEIRQRQKLPPARLEDVQAVFREIDKDNSGKVSFSELDKAAGLLQQRLAAAKAKAPAAQAKAISPQLLTELREKYDKNDDDKLNLQEFQALAAEIRQRQNQPPARQADVQAVFQEIDKDGSGTVSFSELDKAAGLLQQRLAAAKAKAPAAQAKAISPQLLTELREKYDKNDDDKLNLQEFQALAAEIRQRQNQPPARQADVQAVFKEIDKDNSGAVSFSELDTAASLLQQRLAAAKAKPKAKVNTAKAKSTVPAFDSSKELQPVPEPELEVEFSLEAHAGSLHPPGPEHDGLDLEMPLPPLALHTAWSGPLRARAQEVDYRPFGPKQTGALSRGHRPGLTEGHAEVGLFPLAAMRSAEVEGLRPLDPACLSEAESQDSVDSLSGQVASRWQPSKKDKRYAFGNDKAVTFSRDIEPLEWSPEQWRKKLKAVNELGQRLPIERFKAAVARVIAINRSLQGIDQQDEQLAADIQLAKQQRQLALDYQNSVARQKQRKEDALARRDARRVRRIERAVYREERQHQVENELLTQHFQAQQTVDELRGALLRVPELRPIQRPELHAEELVQASLVIHDLAKGPLGQQLTELSNKEVNAASRATSSSFRPNSSQAVTHAGVAPAFYPPALHGVPVLPVQPLQNMQDQRWYPGYSAWPEPSQERAPTISRAEGTSRVWL
eukprot:TRINITY_DN4219_c0_g1_i2.p1 TRINITY_DN4219_c0_g1~~TRINITY_DN4219_c0_g1_i2.p1  ORF type:complete len:707 (+),score=196.03 TRINITY_DN4219_c0_g1_i2:215-2335(+)